MIVRRVSNEKTTCLKQSPVKLSVQLPMCLAHRLTTYCLPITNFMPDLFGAQPTFN
jgi:hypothetical protein